MEVFTIVANEVIGLSATECTLIQFSYNPEQIRDPETVLRSAVKDYLKTGQQPHLNRLAGYRRGLRGNP